MGMRLMLMVNGQFVKEKACMLGYGRDPPPKLHPCFQVWRWTRDLTNQDALTTGTGSGMPRARLDVASVA